MQPSLQRLRLATRIPLNDCETYLKALSDLGFPIGDVYLLLGQQFTAQPLPKGVRKGVPKGCYQNAAELAMKRSDLAYCEGYGRPGGLIPVHHAWCVSDAGLVVDPTWPNCADAQYFGIPFNTPWLLLQLAHKDYWGLLAERVPHQFLEVEPTVYLHPKFLPPTAQLTAFNEKRQRWLQPSPA